MFGNSYWSVQGHLGEFGKQQRRAHLASVRARLKLQQRVERLEDDLARMGLLTLALAKLCVDKGVVTSDELKAQMSAIDLADGVEDGRAHEDEAGPGGSDGP